MPCLFCGNTVTCRAHIMPKGIGREIIKRSGLQTLSLVARLVGRYSLTHEAAMTAFSYPVGIKIRGIHVARFIVGGLMVLVQTTRAADASLSADAVTAFGRSAGSNRLTGVLSPFERLG